MSCRPRPATHQTSRPSSSSIRRPSPRHPYGNTGGKCPGRLPLMNEIRAGWGMRAARTARVPASSPLAHFTGFRAFRMLPTPPHTTLEDQVSHHRSLARQVQNQLACSRPRRRRRCRSRRRVANAPCHPGRGRRACHASDAPGNDAEQPVHARRGSSARRRSTSDGNDVADVAGRVYAFTNASQHPPPPPPHNLARRRVDMALSSRPCRRVDRWAVLPYVPVS